MARETESDRELPNSHAPQLRVVAGVLHLSLTTLGAPARNEPWEDPELPEDRQELEGEMQRCKDTLSSMRDEWLCNRELQRLSSKGTWRCGSYGRPLTLRREVTKLYTVNEKRAWTKPKRKPKQGPSLHKGHLNLYYCDGVRSMFGVGSDARLQ